MTKWSVVILLLVGLAICSSTQAKLAPQAADSQAIGLAVGQQAPAFAATDQFGSEQSNDTLKGPNGTVLLFFRSADW